jgi:hypothetical protein
MDSWLASSGFGFSTKEAALVLSGWGAVATLWRALPIRLNPQGLAPTKALRSWADICWFIVASFLLRP